MRRVWSEENIRAEAAKWRCKTDLQNGCQTAYQAAVRKGIINDLYPEIRKSWDIDRIRAESKKYSTKKEFGRGSPGAYGAAFRRFPGLLDELFDNAKPAMDNDTIYIWRAVGQFHNGKPVYKIGVTSARLGLWRVRLCAQKWGFDFDLICCETLRNGVKATDVEKRLHLLGESPGYSGVDGATEFRALSDSAVYLALSIICQHIIT